MAAQSRKKQGTRLCSPRIVLGEKLNIAKAAVSLMVGKNIVMLVCYLDDSGKDPQNRITTVAGYVANDEQWEAFETEVETWFAEFGVNVFHAKELHSTDGDFADWTVLRKQAFVARLCQAASHHLQMAVSMSALKSVYDERAEESDRKRTIRPYTFCFNVILDWLLRGIRTGREAHTDGLAFVLECGHENNSEAEATFHDVRRRHKLESVLRSISFVPKENCRAIQMADLIAFYSRRHGDAIVKAPLDEQSNVPGGMMMNLIAGSLPIRSFVATDFGPDATVGRPF